jgi:hypothetical protein
MSEFMTPPCEREWTEEERQIHDYALTTKRALGILEDAHFQIMQGRWNADKRVREQIEKAIALLKPELAKTLRSGEL